MGLFSKKHQEPLIHPEVRRSILVPGGLDDVLGRLGGYSDLQSPKHATAHTVLVAESEGWTIIQLPPALHPWVFHNLGFWLLEARPGGERTILRSAAGPTHPAYCLVDDPELDDCLCGVDEHGEGWTVSVPTNDIVRPEAVPARADLPVVDPPAGHRSVEILLEDPGRHLNPTNEATARSRRRLARSADDVTSIF